MTALFSLLFIAITPIDCKITNFSLHLLLNSSILCLITGAWPLAVYHGEEYEEEGYFGQEQVPLTDEIREILEEYPDGQIFNVSCQSLMNSDKNIHVYLY